MPALHSVIPRPVSVIPASGTFTLAPGTGIYVEPATAELTGLGEALARVLRPATGLATMVMASTRPPQPNIQLTTTGADPALGAEGYELVVTATGITLVAYRPAGLFYGIQTIRQLLPAAIEIGTIQPGPWEIAAATIRDAPRFPWRGAMLDVARHYFSVDDIKRYIDLLAAYKLNRLHLHLSDDQGWRIEIKARPSLAEVGGSTQVGGGLGGYYTQAEYAEIVRYAGEHYIVVVPEVDMPGHINAALASCPELNCTGIAPARYTGTEVGFSSLCTDRQFTYAFLDDVIGEVAALTPGPYFHIGGDEAAATPRPAYIAFIERVQRLVEQHGKQMVGWEEIAAARLVPSTIVQFWNTRGHGPDLARAAAAQGARVILSPASRTYLDMQYAPDTRLGLNWAGYLDVRDAFDWEPATLVPGLPADSILGVESPLWTETTENIGDIEFLTFPRLTGHAEIGWSPANRAWEEYRQRLAAHGPRWRALAVNFYPSPQIDWAESSRLV